MNKITLDIGYTPQQIEFLSSESKFTVVPKGRRFGATHGMINDDVENMIDGVSPNLWVDTVYSNIDRYFERYAQPMLHKSGIDYHWDKQKKILKIYDAVCDFRSADRPENIEGFGYRKIYLNEAGIILKNPYLYSNAILPMMMDFENAQLFAVGVPKGKELKHGGEHPYYTLYKRALAGSEGYSLFEYSSYDNPLLNEDDIRALEDEIAAMSPQMVDQEIYGKFIDAGGLNPFAYAYDMDRHESTEAVYQPDKRVYFSVDWNLNPFCANVWHHWEDSKGIHDHCFDEISLANSSIPAMADRMKEKYGRALDYAIFTGDSMGSQKDLARRDNKSNWEVLKRELEYDNGKQVRSLNWRHQFNLPHNPSHENSRADVNYVLTHHPDFKVNPKTAPGTCRDFRLVQCDAFGGIIKRNRKDITQQADFLDCSRYVINTHLHKWIKSRRR